VGVVKVKRSKKLELRRFGFLHYLHRGLVLKLLDLPLVVKPVLELLKVLSEGFGFHLSAVCNPLPADGAEQPLNLPVLPWAARIGPVVLNPHLKAEILEGH